MIKTGVAVALSMWLVQLTGRPYDVFAGIAAVLSVQRSVAESRRTLVTQGLASLLGAAIGGGAVYLIGSHPLAIGLVVITMIALATRLAWRDAMGTAVFVAIVIMDHREGDYLAFALWRFAAVMTGTICGVAVNAWLLPPKHGQAFASLLLEAAGEVDRFVGLVGRALNAPEQLGKAEIKEASARAVRLTDRAKASLALWQDEQPEGTAGVRRELFDKAVNTLYSTVERGLDLHRAALVATAGGCAAAYAEATRMTLESIAEWRGALYRRIADAAVGRPPGGDDERLRKGVAELLSRLERMTIGELGVITAAAGVSVEELHARIEAHNMADEARHMARRLESLARLLEAR